MNNVILKGEIIKNPEFEYECKGINFYTSEIAIRRNSGTEDILPIHISGNPSFKEGDYVSINGTYRSHNKIEDGKSKLKLYVLINDIEILDNPAFENQIDLEGYICKEPICRKTPLGRKVTDILIAVNRKHQKSDYIPLIFWNQAALTVKDFEVGQPIKIQGRIQSRIYNKNGEDKIAYEVSANNFEKLSTISD